MPDLWASGRWRRSWIPAPALEAGLLVDDVDEVFPPLDIAADSSRQKVCMRCGRNWDNSLSPIRWQVSGIRGQAGITTSDRDSSAYRFSFVVGFSSSTDSGFPVRIGSTANMVIL